VLAILNTCHTPLDPIKDEPKPVHVSIRRVTAPGQMILPHFSAETDAASR